MYCLKNEREENVHKIFKYIFSPRRAATRRHSPHDPQDLCPLQFETQRAGGSISGLSLGLQTPARSFRESLISARSLLIQVDVAWLTLTSAEKEGSHPKAVGRGAEALSVTSHRNNAGNKPRTAFVWERARFRLARLDWRSRLGWAG